MQSALGNPWLVESVIGNPRRAVLENFTLVCAEVWVTDAHTLHNLAQEILWLQPLNVNRCFLLLVTEESFHFSPF